ncbi:AEC family transporter [Oscillibacter sp. MSJ-2]|uniref:AEC family transporter n=1 Tax=Dysosmobacter acutus TaxID=2841504 RepID=A0ABS6F5R3_9FIRM|nr:AEC family transporter [Dysosmobacter acutus]MBU5625643.1 AEC family transporter [Dysosmobacter acutus]
MNQEVLSTAISSVALFLLLTIPGFLFARKNWISGEQMDGLSSIVVNYLSPATILNALIHNTLTPQLLLDAGTALGTMLAGIILGIVVGYLYMKLRRTGPNPGYITLFLMTFSNTGFIGIPLLQMLLGTDALLFAACGEVVNDLCIFSFGMMIAQVGCGQARRMNLRGLLNPCFLCAVGGVAILLSGIQLPELVNKLLSTAAGGTVPVVMFLIGAQLGKCDLKSLFGERRLYEIVALKLIGVPGLLFLLVYVLLGVQTFAVRAILLMTAMPCATICAILTRQYHGDADLASRAVMLSTLFSVVTIPFWVVVTAL